MLLDLPLLSRRRLVDPALEPAGFESPHYAADLGDLLEQRLRFALELGGRRLDVVRPAARIDDVRDSTLVGEDLLSATGDLHRLRGWAPQGFVLRVSGEGVSV